jgi:uncharacterized membrane protein
MLFYIHLHLANITVAEVKDRKSVRSWDLSLIVILSLVLVAFISFLPDNPLRIVIGLPFILFFPGYALISTLFPEKKSLDIIERVALSFGVSIAIVPLIGFVLNYTSFGIRLEPILYSLAGFIILFSVVAMWRRVQAKEAYQPFDFREKMESYRVTFAGESRVDKVLTIVLVIAILSSVTALAYVVAVPKEGESFTEFYILGPNGQAADYPHNLSIGQEANVIVGIANHEFRTVNYTVQVWLSDMTYQENNTIVNSLYYVESFSVRLDHVDASIEGNWTSQWEREYTISVPFAGQYKMWFVLLLDGVPTPYMGAAMVDLAGSQAALQFLNTIASPESYTLNLNLNVT